MCVVLVCVVVGVCVCVFFGFVVACHLVCVCVLFVGGFVGLVGCLLVGCLCLFV